MLEFQQCEGNHFELLHFGLFACRSGKPKDECNNMKLASLLVDDAPMTFYSYYSKWSDSITKYASSHYGFQFSGGDISVQHFVEYYAHRGGKGNLGMKKTAEHLANMRKPKTAAHCASMSKAKDGRFYDNVSKLKSYQQAHGHKLGDNKALRNFSLTA
jgi:hypothetical protein